MSDQLALFIDFENVAIWAEENFFDLELNHIMKYLQSRGPVVVKRAYDIRAARWAAALIFTGVNITFFCGFE